MEAEPKNAGMKNKIILIMAAVIFIVGFGLGYYIFGYHKKDSRDYKDELRDVIAYIDSLEKGNKTLAEQVQSMQSGNNPQSSSIVARLNTLERENASLRTSLGQNQALVQENMQLRSRLQSMEAQLSQMRPAPGMPVQPAPQPPVQQPPR